MRSAIIIIGYNNDKLVNQQLHGLRTFCPEPDRIMIDNGSHPAKSETIEYWCKQHKTTYIRARCEENDPSLNHAFGCNLAYSQFKNDYDILFYMDHDMFLLKPFDLSGFMGDYFIAGLPQVRRGIKYYWPGLTIFNFTRIERSLVDFYPCEATGGVRLDTGGGNYKICQQTPEDRQYDFREIHVKNPLYNGSFYNFYADIDEGLFMHFINGSNWADVGDNEQRVNGLLTILREKLEVNV